LANAALAEATEFSALSWSSCACERSGGGDIQIQVTLEDAPRERLRQVTAIGARDAELPVRGGHGELRCVHLCRSQAATC
jgi:hypothetical protein